MVDTVRTEAQLQAIFADLQAAGSITPQDVRDFIVSSRYLANQGWEFVLDSTYTSGSPRAIAAGIRTQVTIDGLLETSAHPAGSTFWNTSTNKLIPDGLNNFGIVRLHCAAQSTAASVNRFEVELDVGGAASVIYQETAVFAKGAGSEQNFNFMLPLFSGADFQANGGTFYITPLADATFHTFALTSVKIYGAAP
ncbi:MAG: hypothetical protein ACYSW3_09150 [Planctomycetota bacterium]|jgi:hypothetical protein